MADLAADQTPKAFLDDLEAFLVYAELEANRSANTVKAYAADLRHAACFFARQHVHSWRDLQPEQVSLYLSELTLQHLQSSTLARKRTALRQLAKFLVREKRRDDDFTRNVMGPRMRRPLPHTLSESDVDKLLNTADDGTAPGLRDRAILELLYSSGLRVSELCGLQLHEIELPERFVRVTGKGDKQRLVPIGDRAAAAIENYLDAGRPGLVTPKTDSTVFLNRFGRPLSRVSVWSLLQKSGDRAGLDGKHLKPHLLRHSFATHLLAHGADLRVIQEILGHASIATTQIYTAIDAPRLVDAYKKHHPRARAG